jgi:hypothetical protein
MHKRKLWADQTVPRRVEDRTVTSSENRAGERTHLPERGVRFDFQYVSDSLWNIKSVQKERLASWNRYRGTVDIDFGALAGRQGLYFHATALWQGGGNLGTYLGLLTGPSGMASANTCRLDSWWLEKRWLDQRISVRGSVRRSGFLRSPALRGVLHLRADGLRVGQFIYDPRSPRPSLGPSDGSPRRPQTQPLL